MEFCLGVFGHANMDFIANLDKLPEPNTSIEIVEQQRFFGGTAANVARAAAKLGVKTFLSSFVGEDFPADFQKALERDGVKLEDLKKMEGYLTPTCWIMADREHNQIAVMNQGPMRDMDRFAVERERIEHYSHIHICTGRPGYHGRVVDEAMRMGKHIGFDPAQEIHYVYGPETFMGILSKSNMFFCNASEMRKALDYSGGRDEEDLLEHVEMVVLTLGKEGSRIISRKEKMEIPAVRPEKVVDTTGAGDAYRAGFYAAMSRGMDMFMCGLHGSAASSFVVESMGPQSHLPTWDMLRKRLEEQGLI
ncbi:MAG: carbohydrate kinase family protein [Candidatus Thermoplasmatota archaeon]|nr:carbohydrate kinase family protein [Candidatus Thermoplasmatota archaeon]